ncbi:MAG: biopolymer transporter ExbD [Lentisphaeria bacterium]|nr:biopolymer transporter ExbD [Lentisphaeria bacterium]
MRHGKKRRRIQQQGAIDEINVTPLLDLTFLLLIVFMITMPLMEHRTSVKPPELNGSTLPENNFKVINLTKTGTILYGQEPVTHEQLKEILENLKKTEPDTQLLLRGDGDQFYKEVINLMKFIRQAGFENITLVTRAEGK